MSKVIWNRYKVDCFFHVQMDHRRKSGLIYGLHNISTLGQSGVLECFSVNINKVKETHIQEEKM